MSKKTDTDDSGRKQLKLYQQLKEAGFPQGGQGNWLVDIEGNRFYVPNPDELYNSIIADPKGWECIRDALASAWLEYGRSK